MEWTLERAYQWQEAGLCSIDQEYEEKIRLKTGSSADGISDGDGTVMGWRSLTTVQATRRKRERERQEETGSVLPTRTVEALGSFQK